MATQYKDGSFSDTQPLDEAMATFSEALDAGTAKAFHVGSSEEIERAKETDSLVCQVQALEAKLEAIDAEDSKLIQASSLVAELKRFAVLARSDSN